MGEPATLMHAFDRVVEAHPERVALLDTGRSGAPAVSYQELSRQVDAAAGVLRELGLARGDVLCNWLPNIREWMVLQFAAAHLGLLTVNLNTRFRARELHDVLATTEAAAIVLPTGFLSIDFAAITREVLGDDSPAQWRRRWPHLRAVIAVDASAEPRPDASASACGDLQVVDLAAALATADPARPPGEGGADDPVDAFTTSGTTGAPKLAMHRQRGVATHCHNVARAFDLRPGDRMLAALPLCGVFGFSGSMAAFLAGAGLVLQPVFDPDDAVVWFEAASITHAYGPDGMLRAILDAAEDPRALGSWRCGAFGNFTGDGAALAARVEDTLGVPMRGVYGSSELFGLMSLWPEDADRDERYLGGGLPVGPDIEVRTADPEDGTLLEHGQDGELQVRGYVVMAGYVGNEQATRATFTSDGWFRTGDFGRTREDGSLVYHTRLGDSLRLGGYLVDPAEIEEHLQSHPFVAAAAVVGVQQPGVGDAAVAFVETADGAELAADDLATFCRGRIAAFKIPARIELVDALPTVEGPNGVKIQRHELRRRGQELLDAPPSA